jgi:Protein of unknown function (DUF1168)
MGRFSSVQAYADNHNGVRKVTYEQASAGAGQAKAPVKPEKVVNPYGSTAGAGSGDFHVYRHSRNRELQRQKHMELSAAEREAEDSFQKQQEQNKEWEEERTAKRRKKRDRLKNVKKRKDNLMKAGISLSSRDIDDAESETGKGKFCYVPGDALKPLETEKDPVDSERTPEVLIPPSEIPNDGSFVEQMKRRSQQNEAEDTSHHE